VTIACLIFATVLPMLNPDGVPIDNGILSPAAIVAWRALSTVLDKDTSFSATVAVTIEGVTDKDFLPSKEEFVYVRNSGWQRFELDAAKVSISLDPEELATLTRLQLLKAIEIMSVGKNTNWIIYPQVKAYIDDTLEIPGLEGQFDLPKIEKEKIGDEIVEGHKCVKYKVRVHCFMGDLDGTRWEADDLRALPIKTIIAEDKVTFTTVLKDVKFAVPPQGVFTVPKGYKRYTSEGFFKYVEQATLKEQQEKANQKPK